MTGLVLTAVLAVLAVVTLIGTRLIERAHPPAGRFVEVEGGRLHLLEFGPKEGQPVVLLHGASGNLGDLRVALGDALAARYRVILIDRPGHGWSDRPGGAADASPAQQAALIHEALTKIGVTRPIMLGHSWSGALATAYGLAFPDATGGLVLLSPVTHPWPGGVAMLNHIVAAPILGPLIAHAIILPAGYFLIEPGVAAVFAPQSPPENYIARSAARMILRPHEFRANGQDLVGLKAFVTEQSKRYGELKMPVTIIAGDIDKTVYTDIHSRGTAAAVPQAKLIVLQGVGHATPHVATDTIVREIDAMAAKLR